MEPNTIYNAVHAVFGVTPTELKGKRRPKEIADARFCAAYLLNTECNIRLVDIAKVFGKSAKAGWSSFAVNRCQEYSNIDKRYAAKVQAVYEKLKEAV